MTATCPPAAATSGTASDLLSQVETTGWPSLEAAAALIADTMAAGGTIHVFGSGHSHILAEELYYRAGGFARVRPILFEGLMLHASAPLEHVARAAPRPRGRAP